ncbi:ABC transporter ATP-binding protein [Roseicyclus sp. F158]|uniref:ABC transporter ATP-binding protein n=1 Tax=Tropicimonas omnivorans TaxID=3075590 RepID=A0ABU3DD14_9RHOB|nr:ABC transporter ATP-binding protein [Roseicyclus sp. F158]MDT0681604.1 ABC transporter ATP-binding protein [Roseicyclus sp. F158]
MSAPPSDDGKPLLEVIDLKTSFGGTRAVDGVDFAMRPGEVLCLVGESGSGKSVTALSVMGLIGQGGDISAGAIRLEGRELTGLTRMQRRALCGDRMGMIFQEPMTSLNPSLTVGDQIAETLLRHRDMTRSAARARVIDLLKEVRIPSPETRIDQYPHQLSGGMRQRVMIAMAMACEPALLIADEPTTALDVTIQAQILDLMRALRRETGTAILMITHDLGVVAEVGDRVAVMYAGRIVETGTVRQIFEDPQHPYTLGLLASIPRLGDIRDRLATIEGTVPPLSEMPEGCRFNPRCVFATETCRAKRPPLETVSEGHGVACWHPMPEHEGRGADIREDAGA